MFSFLKSLLLVAAAAKLAATATCDRDNLLRCFIASPSPASAFCSSYSATSTVTTTVTPTSTATATSTTTTVTVPATASRIVSVTVSTTTTLTITTTKRPSTLTISTSSTTIITSPLYGCGTVTATVSSSTTTITSPLYGCGTVTATVSSSTTTITSPLYGCGTVTATVSSSPTQAVEFNEIYGGKERYFASYRDPTCRNAPDNQQHLSPDTFCEAVQQCADYSANSTLGYYTFTVYAFGGNRNYQCNTYYGGRFDYPTSSDVDGYISFAVEYSHGGPYK